MSDKHAVIQLVEEKIPASVLVPILVEWGGMIPLDARSVANRNKGVLFDTFDRGQSQSVASALSSAGFQVRAVRSDEIPTLPKPHVPAWLMFSSSGLAFPLGLDQKLTVVPWTSVFVVNSTLMHLSDRRQRQVSRRQAWHEEQEESFETVVSAKQTPVTDVIAMTMDDAFCSLRIVRGRTKHRAAVSAANDAVAGKMAEYLGIVQTIVDSSSHAFVADATKLLLAEQRDCQAMSHSESWVRFEELAYQKYNRWMLMMVMLRDGESEGE